MTNEHQPAGRFFAGKVAFGLFLIACVAGVFLIMSRERRALDAARDNLEAGREALLRDQPEEALNRLNECLAVLPQSGEAHFLKARALRQSGDLKGAREYLEKAGQTGRPVADIELEDALLKAREGNYSAVEGYLARRQAEDTPDSVEVIAIMVPTIMGGYRILEAEELTARWVRYRPNSAKAWGYRADTLERLRNKTAAIVAYRQLVEIAPNDRKARLNLARLLNDSRQPVEEALGHVDWLLAGDPNDPAALVQLALCRESQGRADEGAAILDKVIAGPQTDSKALHFRGRLEMNRGGPKAALAFLRRAIEIEPSDVQLRYTFYQCMQQTGTPEEIRDAEQRWRNTETDLRRVSEVAVLISREPTDPNPRREMGELFLRNERITEGIRWLNSALEIDPKHAATHRTLAEHYEKTGQKDLAQKHRAQAGS